MIVTNMFRFKTWLSLQDGPAALHTRLLSELSRTQSGHNSSLSRTVSAAEYRTIRPRSSPTSPNTQYSLQHSQPSITLQPSGLFLMVDPNTGQPIHPAALVPAAIESHFAPPANLPPIRTRSSAQRPARCNPTQDNAALNPSLFCASGLSAFLTGASPQPSLSGASSLSTFLASHASTPAAQSPHRPLTSPHNPQPPAQLPPSLPAAGRFGPRELPLSDESARIAASDSHRMLESTMSHCEGLTSVPEPSVPPLLKGQSQGQALVQTTCSDVTLAQPSRILSPPGTQSPSKTALMAMEKTPASIQYDFPENSNTRSSCGSASLGSTCKVQDAVVSSRPGHAGQASCATSSSSAVIHPKDTVKPNDISCPAGAATPHVNSPPGAGREGSPVWLADGKLGNPVSSALVGLLPCHANYCSFSLPLAESLDHFPCLIIAIAPSIPHCY
jgi:hypothetical protein